MKVECEVHFCQIENERGFQQDGVRVTCSRCGHTTQSFGTSEKSIKRCIMLLKEECPQAESNYYEPDT